MLRRNNDVIAKYLPAKYEGVWGLPLRSGKIRLALDVGGGSGRFAAALRSLYNITCMTTVRLTRPVSITKCARCALGCELQC